VSTIGFLDRLLTPLIVTRSIGLRSKDAGWLAAATAAKQAHRFGTDSVDHVRSQLLALSTFLASRQNPDMKLGELLLSAAFELFVRDGTLSSDERLNSTVRILEDVVMRWPALAGRCKKFVDSMVDDLPSIQSRVLWPLAVKLRAIA